MYWEKAGQRAVQRSANVEAVHHFSEALELLGGPGKTAARKKKEQALRIMLGPALINTKGPLSPEVQGNYARAQRLCTQLPESPMHFAALWGLWRITRDFVEKQRISDELLRLSERLADQGLRLQAHHTQCDYRSHAAMYGGHDPKVCGCGEAAFSLWLLGRADQSLKRADEGLAWARGLAHTGSLAHALDMNLLLHRYRREAVTVLERADEIIDFAVRENFPIHKAKGLVFRGWALAQLGEPKHGIELMRTGLDSQESVGTREDFPIFFDMLAEVLTMTGQSKDGLRLIDHALSETQRSGLRYWTAELHRCKGQLLLIGNRKSTAEDCFRRARRIAHEQRAAALELRAVMSLARLWAENARGRDAYDMLSSVRGQFTEGFETLDFKEATALLEAIA
jgi:predicted ATPase